MKTPQFRIKALALSLTAAFALSAGPIASAVPIDGAMTRDIRVVPNYAAGQSVVEIGLKTRKTDGAPFVEGERVQVYVRASQAGFISLWAVGASGAVSRLWPNEHARDYLRVEANQQVTIPVGSVDFEVQRPTGLEQLFVIHTPTADEQPQDLPVFTEGTIKDLNLVRRSSRTSMARISFQTVDRCGNGPCATADLDLNVQVRPVHFSSGRLFVLSMGANVEGLTHADDDSRRMARLIQRKYSLPDAQVRIHDQATKAQFREGMRWLAQVAGPEDTVLIFFSGHGTTFPDQNGDEADDVDEAYVTMDVAMVDMPDSSHTVLDDEYAEWAGELRTANVVNIFDACHSGGLNKSFSLIGTTKFLRKNELGTAVPKALAATRDVQPVAPATGPDHDAVPAGLMLAAAREHQTALEIPGMGGVFAHFLIDAIGNADGSSLPEVFNQVRSQVVTRTANQQDPIMIGNQATGQRFRF